MVKLHLQANAALQAKVVKTIALEMTMFKAPFKAPLKAPLRLLSAGFLALSCLPATAAEQSAAEPVVAAAESYGYHLDFARKMHALDMAALTQSGYATQLAADEYDALRYQVDFGDKGYTDAYGNQYSGRFEYLATHVDDQVGTTQRMHFTDFKINDVGIRGSKVSTIRSMQDDETASSCWGRSCKRIAASAKPDQALTFTFADGSSVTHDGALTKTLAYDDHGQRFAQISGEFVVTDTNGRYELTLDEPVLMSAHCQWPTAGAVSISQNNSNLARINYGTSSHCSAKMQLVTASDSTVIASNKTLYWQ